MDDPDDGSDTSERTALSGSESEATHVVVDEHFLQSYHVPLGNGPAQVLTHPPTLGDAWHFLLSPAAAVLRRFYAPDFIPGETVIIGEGSSYRVSKSVLSNGSNQVVAIKHVIFDQSSSIGARLKGDSRRNTVETVLRELRMLVHEPVRKNVNVSKLIGYGAEEIGSHFTIFLVADFAPGGTLKDYLADQPNGPISFSERAHFCFDIASGLAGLHACEIVQGDVKLANVLVFPDKEGYVAQLSDFGSSIYEGVSGYTGTAPYNAPELRRRIYTGSKSIADYYSCDVFSFGLAAWEILQGGKPFIDSNGQEDDIVWLNDLPKDYLLHRALQTFEALTVPRTFPKRVIREVLEGSLQDDSEQRISCKAIVKIFRSDRTFSKSGRITSSNFATTSKIPPLQKWSFARTDNLARTVPIALQRELFAQLETNNANSSTAASSTSFDIAMCYLTGFGTDVCLEKFLESLTEAAGHREPLASSMCLRMHSALEYPMSTKICFDQAILEIEEELQQLPNELYYSHRVRRHEALLQKALLNSSFDLYSGATLLKTGVTMREATTLDVVVSFLRDSSEDKMSLRAVPEVFKRENLESFFHLAARLGLMAIVESFLQAGANVDARNEKRATPLVEACHGGHAQVVSLLMRHGADSWLCQRNSVSAFHWLMMFEDNEIPSVLKDLRQRHNSMVMDSVVSQPVELMEHGLSLKWSPVHFAVAVRKLALVKTLLDAGASQKAGNMTPLDLAVANHCPEIARLLISYKLPRWQLTPFLHIGETSTLKLLLLHGNQRRQMLERTVEEVLQSSYGDINQKNDDGHTPLAEAIKETPCDIDMSVLEVLLDQGAQLEVDDRMLMRHLLARDDGKSRFILDLLIERKAVATRADLLSAAVLRGNNAMIDSILATGIDVNERDAEGLPALLPAIIYSGNSYAVQALISHGADVNVELHAELEGKSALELCMGLPDGDGQMLDALIEGGASLMSSDGSTIVHHACKIAAKVDGKHVLDHLFKQHAKIKALVNYGVWDNQEITPIYIACMIGNLEALLVLLENGAEVDISKAFNPVVLTERLGRVPEESLAFKRPGFNLAHWKFTTEKVLMKLLNKAKPGHGRTWLHIATSICNYDRVVELIEQGAQPWRGDAEKITPIGLLTEELVTGHDDQEAQSSVPEFIEQGRKIKKYLKHQMILQASQFKSLDLMDDPPVLKPLENDSPAQLEAHYEKVVEKSTAEVGKDHSETLFALSKLAEAYILQHRWTEAEALQRALLRDRPSNSYVEERHLVDHRSRLIQILIAVNNLVEAEKLVVASLAEATKEKFESGLLEEGFSTNANGTPIEDEPNETQQHPSDFYQEGLISKIEQIIAVDAALLNQCLGNYAVLLALFDASLIMEARGDVHSALRIKERVVEGSKNNGSCNEKHLHRMVSRLICNYCALERWDDAARELELLLGQLEFVDAENFPVCQTDLLDIAYVYTEHGRWEKAAEIFQKVQDHCRHFRGEVSYYSINASRHLVSLYENLKKYKKAGKIQSELLDSCKRAYGFRSTASQLQALALATIYEKEGRIVEASILQKQAVSVLESLGDENLENTLIAKRQLCKTLQKQESFQEAESLAIEVLAGFKSLRGEDAHQTNDAANELAQVFSYQGRAEESIAVRKGILQTQERIHGEFNDITRNSLLELMVSCLRANLFEEAEIVSKRAIRISEAMYGSESVVAATVTFYLSSIYEKAGRLEDSRDVKCRVLELERRLYPDGKNKDILYTMTGLAHDHYALGELEAAISLRLEALDGYRSLEGDYERQIMETTFALASSYHDAQKFQEARINYEAAIVMSRRLHGDEHETTIEYLSPLMALYTETDDYQLAETVAYEILWFMTSAHGDDHHSTQRAIQDVVIIQKSLDNWREVERQAQPLVSSLSRTHGNFHADTISATETLADSLSRQKKHKAALPLFEKLLAHQRANLLSGDDDASIQIPLLLSSLIESHRALSNFSLALPLAEELLGTHTTEFGPNHDTTLTTTSILANIYFSQERYPEAEELELSILKSRQALHGEDSPKTLEAKENLSKTWLEVGRYGDAAKSVKEVLAVREKRVGAGFDDSEEKGEKGKDKDTTEEEEEDFFSTLETLRDIYTASKQWSSAQKLAERLLAARYINAEHPGDINVISALEGLKIVETGLGGRAEEVEQLIVEEREKRRKWNMFR